MASGADWRTAPKARTNSPNAFVNRKLDKELATRAVNRLNHTTDVIVTFTDGQLPPEFASFVKDGHSRLGIINGYAINVPNWLLKTLAAHPNVVQFHVDRPLYKDRSAHWSRSARVRCSRRSALRAPALALQSSTRASRGGTTTSQAPPPRQRVDFVDFVDGDLSRMTTTATAPTSPASSPATASDADGGTRASRPAPS